MPKKKFTLSVNIKTTDPKAIKNVLDRVIGTNGTIKSTSEGFDVKAKLEGESAMDLNRICFLKCAESSAEQEFAPNGVLVRLFKSSLTTLLKA